MDEKKTELTFDADPRFDSIEKEVDAFEEAVEEAVEEATLDVEEAVEEAIADVEGAAESVEEAIAEEPRFAAGAEGAANAAYNAPDPAATTKAPADLSKFTQYIPMLAAIIGFLWIVPMIFGLISSILYRIYYMSWGVMSPLYSFVRIFSWIKGMFVWIILILAVVAIAGLVYMLLVERKDQEKQMLFIGIACAALVLISCIVSRAHGPGFLTFLFALCALVLGIDLAMNVFIEKQNLYGKFKLSDDIALLVGMISKHEKVDKAQYTDANIPQYEQTEEIESLDSVFDGPGSELFVKNLLLSLLSIVTCGLGAPYMLVRILAWKKEHTVIEGRRLKFNGTAPQLFGLWIKWWFLSLITCGVYSIFARADYMRWVSRHTAYIDEPEYPDGIYPTSRFEGAAPEVLGYSMVTSMITSVTCGLGFPWAVGMQKKWEAKNTVICNDRLFYDGTGKGLFGTYLINLLLTAVTCGIYGAWATCRLERYFINHTHVDATSRR